MSEFPPAQFQDPDPERAAAFEEWSQFQPPAVFVNYRTACHRAFIAGYNTHRPHIEALEKLVIEWGRGLDVRDVHPLDRALVVEAHRLAALARKGEEDTNEKRLSERLRGLIRDKDVNEIAKLETRIEALENWGEDAEGALVYASTILGSYAKDGNPAELAEGECDRVFAHWVTRRTGGDIMSSRGNLEWYDKNVKTPRVLELEARIKALEKDIRQLCWNIPEGSNYLICEFCAAEVEDGADQVTLDAAHEPGCRAALAAKENRP